MLCQNCKKREATINRTEVIGGTVCTVHLCALCANEMFGEFESEVASAYSSGLFSEPDGGRQKSCPSCGLRFSDYEKSGLLGCPSCYDVFNEELIPYITRIQGKTVHIGKVCTTDAALHDLRSELSSLQVAMEKALARGDFGKAEEINRRMAAIRKRGGGKL